MRDRPTNAHATTAIVPRSRRAKGGSSTGRAPGVQAGKTGVRDLPALPAIFPALPASRPFGGTLITALTGRVGRGRTQLSGRLRFRSTSERAIPLLFIRSGEVWRSGH
jgi:hypothetical protein